jgi:group I intron endonuclease
MVGYIYKYENLINHKVYIGQTIDLNARRASHVYKAKTVKNKFYNAVRKYGWEGFNYSVIAQIEAEDIKELSTLLDTLEEQYIEQYDSFHNGYNSTTGGHSCRGVQMPESFIEYCKNRTYSEETRRKMSEAAHNRVYSGETREKLSKAAKKRGFAKYREIYAEKMLKNRKEALSKPVLQINKEGKVINEFSSIREAVAFIITYLAPDRKEMGIWKGLYRHFIGETKKRLYYGFEWKLKSIV